MNHKRLRNNYGLPKHRCYSTVLQRASTISFSRLNNSRKPSDLKFALAAKSERSRTIIAQCPRRFSRPACLRTNANAQGVPSNYGLVPHNSINAVLPFRVTSSYYYANSVQKRVHAQFNSCRCGEQSKCIKQFRSYKPCAPYSYYSN